MIVQEWHSATAVAKAFAIGKGEAAAVSALMSEVHPTVLARITESVKIRGMHRFLTHDAIGRGVFSMGFSSGIGNIEAWNDVLTNSEDQELEPQLQYALKCLVVMFQIGNGNHFAKGLVCEYLLFNEALLIF